MKNCGTFKIREFTCGTFYDVSADLLNILKYFKHVLLEKPSNSLQWGCQSALFFRVRDKQKESYNVLKSKIKVERNYINISISRRLLYVWCIFYEICVYKKSDSKCICLKLVNIKYLI